MKIYARKGEYTSLHNWTSQVEKNSVILFLGLQSEKQNQPCYFMWQIT